MPDDIYKTHLENNRKGLCYGLLSLPVGSFWGCKAPLGWHSQLCIPRWAVGLLAVSDLVWSRLSCLLWIWASPSC